MAKVRKLNLPDSSFLHSGFSVEDALENRGVLLQLSSLMTQLAHFLDSIGDGQLVILDSPIEVNLIVKRLSDIEATFGGEVKAKKQIGLMRQQDQLYIDKVGNCLFECSILMHDIESASQPFYDDHECGFH
ncbi:hypothetical protein OTK49_01790 [Vibrio coralliirubri]|uniref:hypothetical protein n=1 Tax=Vibrio coralliirubri TaxID=1516159 RepID=UPI002283BFE3|nr:hypothetical protein [Vibrio coralliirubri]MCY9861245.1 hypothetical protein [Vibrio coralliirubri]